MAFICLLKDFCNMLLQLPRLQHRWIVHQHVAWKKWWCVKKNASIWWNFCIHLTEFATWHVVMLCCKIVALMKPLTRSNATCLITSAYTQKSCTAVTKAPNTRCLSNVLTCFTFPYFTLKTFLREIHPKVFRTYFVMVLMFANLANVFLQSSKGMFGTNSRTSWQKHRMKTTDLLPQRFT